MAYIKQNKWIVAYAVSFIAYIVGITGIAANAPYNPFPLAFHMTIYNILEQSAVFVLLIALSLLITGITSLYLSVRQLVRWYRSVKKC